MNKYILLYAEPHAEIDGGICYEPKRAYAAHFDNKEALEWVYDRIPKEKSAVLGDRRFVARPLALWRLGNLGNELVWEIEPGIAGKFG